MALSTAFAGRQVNFTSRRGDRLEQHHTSQSHTDGMDLLLRIAYPWGGEGFFSVYGVPGDSSVFHEYEEHYYIKGIDIVLKYLHSRSNIAGPHMYLDLHIISFQQQKMFVNLFWQYNKRLRDDPDTSLPGRVIFHCPPPQSRKPLTAVSCPSHNT